MQNISQKISQELNVKESQVEATIVLLDGGSSVPFIARYRKEATGGLDDTQLRTLSDRLSYIREINARKATILETIEGLGKLTPELKAKIMNEDSKATLEDIYQPYKPKRRTKAQIAREAGLEPLALKLLADPSLDLVVCAQEFFNKEKQIETIEDVLNGARDILIENFSEEADLVNKLREQVKETACVYAKVVKGKEVEAVKFETYFDYSEPWKKVPSHRALAMFRGRKEGFLRMGLNFALEGEDEKMAAQRYGEAVAQYFNIANKGRPCDEWLMQTAFFAWATKLSLHIEVQLFMQLREASEEEAIRVFATNLKDLLLASPAGPKVTLGLDPGFRTGVKFALVDQTGKVVQTGAIFPHPPQSRVDESLNVLIALIKKYRVQLVAIGNGTASRETERLVGMIAKEAPELKFDKIVVSEAGASVYSASELAAKEFPDLDVSIRGAVSIARRLQDPLAELVKIDPKSIGVGQYQHDVNQSRLGDMLGAVVEDCVNGVGVDVNMASAALLSYISGLSMRVAENIVQYRDKKGAFKNRSEIKQASGVGEKVFEQAAGFLRISNGDNPLDGSGVHPESYQVVESILSKHKKTLADVIGNKEFLSQVKASDFVTAQFGLPTVKDILVELEKPGRDPRPEFKTATFKDNVEEIKDLTVGMLLEGVVTNVTKFGAFVDIGVHRDGLVHISALCNRFIADPSEVVKTGQIVKVKVLEVDEQKGRINLTMRLDDAPTAENKGKKPEAKAKPKLESKNYRSDAADSPFSALLKLKI
jgi:uncharacterized protein